MEIGVAKPNKQNLPDCEGVSQKEALQIADQEWDAVDVAALPENGHHHPANPLILQILILTTTNNQLPTTNRQLPIANNQPPLNYSVAALYRVFL